MWTDNETDQDLLGFSIHADLLCSIVTDESMLPVTVGLFGDWGGGKSSILKMLKTKLNDDNEHAVIYFNSWVFEGYEDAKSAILTSLLKELLENRNLKSKIGDDAKKLLKRVNWMKLLKIGASAGASFLTSNPLPLLMAGTSLFSEESTENSGSGAKGINLSNIKPGELLKAAEDSVVNVKSFRNSFQKLIEKTELKSLIVLIDDLDRCSPERLIENLEAIRLFLNVERTAFVVATDRRIVENAIRIRYSDLFSGRQGESAGEALIIDYLEKLIQVPLTLPKLAPHEVRSYLCLLFLKKYLGGPKFGLVLEEYNKHIAKERYTAFQLRNELDTMAPGEAKDAVVDSMRLVDACSDAITDGLKGNPRQIKRFLNAFWIRKELAKVAGITGLKDHILIKLMVLEYISSECFENVYQWHRSSSAGVAEELEELEKSKSLDDIGDKHPAWKKTRLLRWLQTDPKICGEDLRDYFWVARNAIQDTFSGVRLMTQAMKACAEQLASSVETGRKAGVELYKALGSEERDVVLGVIARTALQNTSEDAALRSLVDLCSFGYLEAAGWFEHCIERIPVDSLSPGFGITLKNFKQTEGNKAADHVIRIREKLGKSQTKIGRAISTTRRIGK